MLVPEADQLVKKKADVLFSLKENHERLYKDVKEFFEGLDFSAEQGILKKLGMVGARAGTETK
jgi:hypothetical protein